ncbi:hypothetical protein TMUPMC115_0960 [Tetragenococcus muriaticus PMC-11-5]|uniref:Phage protein n=1 Tax=Tetragenococcus muriaticus PMC-11-5 TaxID=1302649 RepID=A0A091CDT9_9ENTE|nr:hypothetical protein [Tetragenococcus muriaticus]KFN92448.1 hypothetical protein TMUPMC115_0960 [Tetragenococcus muriaticus PMC-11-5]
MAKLKLELENENEETVVYTKEKVKGRAVRKAFQTMKKIEEADYEEQLDTLIDYVVDVFDNPGVTEDSILDGIESEELMSTLSNVITDVVGVDPEDADNAQAKSNPRRSRTKLLGYDKTTYAKRLETRGYRRS